MPELEVLRQEDAALAEIHAGIKENMSEDDEKALRELIDSQREAYTTHAEIKDESGKVEEVTVQSIGNKALSNPYAVHSESWHTEEK